MNLNPEFQRNLWLEMTLHRVVGMPLVLGAVFLLVYLSSSSTIGKEIAEAAFGLYSVLTFGWGTYLAAEAVTGEIKSRTWDIQRMSSIGPWAMTWGKLIGSTIFPWYGGLICLAVCAVFGNDQDTTLILLLFLTSVLCQSVALLASLLSIGRRNGLDRSAIVAHLFVGVISIAPFWSLYRLGHVVTWFGHPYAAGEFALISAALWGFWALVGCYRQMSAELQVAGTPVVWVAFLLFVWLFIAGFVPNPSGSLRTLLQTDVLIGFGLMLALTYGTVFADRKEPAAFRRMLIAARAGTWRKLLEEMPTWMPTLLMAAVFGLLGAVLVATAPSHPQAADPAGAVNDMIATPAAIIWVFTVFLFTVRDVAVVLFFNLGTRRARADGTAALYLAILYGLLPAILRAMGLRELAVMFWPWFFEHPAISFTAGLAQVILAAVLVARRWERGFGKPRPVTGS